MFPLWWNTTKIFPASLLPIFKVKAPKCSGTSVNPSALRSSESFDRLPEPSWGFMRLQFSPRCFSWTVFFTFKNRGFSFRRNLFFFCRNLWKIYCSREKWTEKPPRFFNLCKYSFSSQKNISFLFVPQPFSNVFLFPQMFFFSFWHIFVFLLKFLYFFSIWLT